MPDQDVTSSGPASAANGQADPQTQAATTQKFTEADVQSRVSAAVNEAQRKWKKDLDDLVADKTKDAEAKIAELKLSATENAMRADFAEQALTAGVNNVKAAYIVARHGGYMDNGKLDLDRFKKENPQFFGSTAKPRTDAGAGGNTPTGGMNAYIRAAAGVG